MKKIVMIFAAMAAVLSSCQKSELESVSVNDGKDIVLNISVSNPDADTKAIIKSTWAENDEISIWYDSNVQENPDLVVKYDGAKWIQKEGATVSGKTPSEGDGKYAKALYNGTVKVASKDDYTFADNTLTFKIEHWVFLTEVQVVVKGLTSASAGSYTLACDKFTPLATGNGYTVGLEAITASKGNKGDAVTGIPNTDGVAFVFATAEYSSTAAAYKFTLIDNTSTPAVTKEYTATTTKINGTTGSMTAIKALTIESNSFTAPGPEYVEMKMGTGEGAYTLKWATMNLGATTVAGNLSTCAGDYYQWGSVNTLYNEIPWNSLSEGFLTITSWKTGKEEGFVESNSPYYSDSEYTKYTDTDGKTVLEAIDDAVAAAYPGTDWRMPTSQEFEDLADACGGSSGYNTSADPGKDTSVGKGIYWCTNYDGVAGCLFCDGTNKLFFPAAGCGGYLMPGFGTYLCYADSCGFYWSSSLNTDETDDADNLYFESVSVNPKSLSSRYYGFPVRPVKDVK